MRFDKKLNLQVTTLAPPMQTIEMLAEMSRFTNHSDSNLCLTPSASVIGLDRYAVHIVESEVSKSVKEYIIHGIFTSLFPSIPNATVKRLPDGSYEASVPHGDDYYGVYLAIPYVWSAITLLETIEAHPGLSDEELYLRLPMTPEESPNDSLEDAIERAYLDVRKERMSRVMKDAWNDCRGKDGLARLMLPFLRDAQLLTSDNKPITLPEEYLKCALTMERPINRPSKSKQ